MPLDHVPQRIGPRAELCAEAETVGRGGTGDLGDVDEVDLADPARRRPEADAEPAILAGPHALEHDTPPGVCNPPRDAGGLDVHCLDPTTNVLRYLVFEHHVSSHRPRVVDDAEDR